MKPSGEMSLGSKVNDSLFQVHFGDLYIQICLQQGGNYPGNQGKVRENEKGLKWSRMSQVI